MKKPRIGIVGLWFTKNYGGVLTAYALYTALAEAGWDVTFIDMRQADLIGNRNGRVESFIREHCSVSSIYEDGSALYNTNEIFDVFLVGSDQCWRSCYVSSFDFHMLLNFVNDSKKKISYGTSFATKEYEGNEDEKKRVSVLLKRFDKISVREESGVEISKKTFETNAAYVIDPIFFLQNKKWIEMAKMGEEESKIPYTHYILCYFLDVNEELETLKIRLKAVNPEYSVCTILGTDAWNPEKIDVENVVAKPDIPSFVRYYQNANYVITDSFHGMCLALILKKPFLVYVNGRRGEERFLSLLKKFHLEDRAFYNHEDVVEKMIPSKILWDDIHKKIDDFKETSWEWLMAALNTDNIEKENKYEGLFSKEIDNSILISKRIAIYGSGYVGKLFLNWLKEKGYDLRSVIYLATRPEGSDVLGISVIGVNDIIFEEDMTTILAAREQIIPEMETELKKRGCKKYHIITEEVYRRLAKFDLRFTQLIETDTYQKKQAKYMNRMVEENKTKISDIHVESCGIRDFLIRKMKKACLNFEVQVAEHCNLNCAGCDHFSPIAEKGFIKTEHLKRDYRRIAELTGGNVGKIKLLGGEPLLHSEINKIMILTRECFPCAYIEIVTNGILLLQESEEFWEICHRNRIVISVTKYPISLDFDEISHRAKIHSVNLYYINDETEKTLWYLPIDEEGQQNPSVNFYHCWRINECITLKDGKLFNCVIPAHIEHFNRFFGKEIPVTEQDAIDIYKVNSMDEILDFLAKPKPFCRFCNLMAESNGHPWHRSEKAVEEWM